jgi:hypothetical protein
MMTGMNYTHLPWGRRASQAALFSLLFAGSGIWAAAGCGPKGACSGSGMLTGHIVNYSSGGIVVDALTVLQTGGLAAVALDPSKGNPAYRLSAPVDSTGTYTATVSCGHYGVRAYAPGFHCAAGDALAGLPLTLGLTMNAATDKLPSLDAVAASPSSAVRGSKVTFSANIVAGDPQDPLSDQVFLINTVRGLVHPLDPPSPGVGGAFPNGHWSKQVTVPSEPGVYRYALVAATQKCLVSLAFFSINVN